MWDWRKPKQPYPTGGQVLTIPTADILPSPHQPRRQFSYEKLLELAQSISENGLLQPLTVTLTDSGQAVLVAGERRLRAAKIAGIRAVPCLVVQATDEQSAVLALVENLQRQDLNCFEQAESIDKLIRLYGMTQDEAATKLGCSQPTVANKLRLLALSPEEREALLAGGATERHARALLQLPSDKRLPLIRRLTAEHWTVARTEREVERLQTAAAPAKRVLPLVRDVRLFFNTVDHAVDTMRRSGVQPETEQNETDTYYEYRIRIPKPDAAMAGSASSVRRTL